MIFSMKRIAFALAGTALFSCSMAEAQSNGQSLFGKVVNTVAGKTGSSSSTLSNTDIVSGLREALTTGAKNASSKLNVANGFFGNSLIKILMPPELKQAETTLRGWGMGSMVDKLILSMNRSAEDAAGQAVPIFVNAITGMSIQDGLSILQGGNNAATNYLRNTTTAALTTAFRPVIEKSLGKIGTTQLWSQVFTAYNKLPIVRNKINPDLTGYVTGRALNGLFVTIADEETKIRTNPAAQVTDLLKKVFGKG
jgi:hypothetical protein